MYTDIKEETLYIAWQNNNTITALSTVHTVHKDDDWIEHVQKHPSKTSTNTATAQKSFDNKPIAKLKIPRLIDDYNYYISGVDIANQLRAVYETHHKLFHSWWPLFY